jgi:hypothetical protein
MTTRMQLVVTDDLDEFEKHEFNDTGPDGAKDILSLNGIVVELDLTPAHSAELHALLKRYLEAGHRPGEEPQPAVPRMPSPRPGQGVRREIPGTRDFYRELREWADEHGIEIPQAGTQGSKKNYVYTRVIPAYIAHLKDVAAEGKDGGVAAARLAMAALLRLPGTEGGQPAVSLANDFGIMRAERGIPIHRQRRYHDDHDGG